MNSPCSIPSKIRIVLKRSRPLAKSKSLKNLLVSLSENPMAEQYESIKAEYDAEMKLMKEADSPFDTKVANAIAKESHR